MKNNPPTVKSPAFPIIFASKSTPVCATASRDKPIVASLNSIPEVTATAGRRICQPSHSRGNLSEWKKRNHPAWLLQQTALAQASRFSRRIPPTRPSRRGHVTDHLATFVATQYAQATRQLADEVDASSSLQPLARPL